MRPSGPLLGLTLLGLALSPALAQTKVARTPAAGAPIPVPYPDVPEACAPDLKKLTEDADRARARLEEAAKREKLPKTSAEIVERERLVNAHATCCLTSPIAIAESPRQSTSLTICQSTLATAVARAKPARTSLTVKDMLSSCKEVTDMAAADARSTAKAPLPKTVKQALEEVSRAQEKLAAGIAACAAKVAPPPPPQGAAAPPPPVGPNGSCDDAHRCGPALECRDGKCRLPCGCAAPCFLEGGQCKENVMVRRTVRKSCAVCVPPCSRDADGVCRSDTIALAPDKQACAPICP